LHTVANETTGATAGVASNVSAQEGNVRESGELLIDVIAISNRTCVFAQSDGGAVQEVSPGAPLRDLLGGLGMRNGNVTCDVIVIV